LPSSLAQALTTDTADESRIQRLGPRLLLSLLDDESTWEEEGPHGWCIRVTSQVAVEVLIEWGSAAAPILPELLRLMQHSSNPDVRARAAAVARHVSDDSLGAVMGLVADSSVRLEMLGVLRGWLSATRAEHTPHLLEVLRLLLHHERAVVRAAHAVLLGAGLDKATDLESVPAYAAALRALLRETPDTITRLAIRDPITLSCFIGMPSAAEALARAVLASGFESWRSIAALHSMGPLLSQPTVEALIKRFAEGAAHSTHLLELLKGFGPRAISAALPLVASISHDPTPGKRATYELCERRKKAAVALGTIAPGGGPGRGELVRLLAQADDDVSELAASVLRPRTVPLEVWLPTVAFGLNNRDVLGETRRRAARALSFFGAEAVHALDELRAAMRVSNTLEGHEAMTRALRGMSAAALPALPELISWLEKGPQRLALEAIGAIGPAARPEAEAILEALRAEKQARLVVNFEGIDHALAALRGQSLACI
jgi:hypothetical protein